MQNVTIQPYELDAIYQAANDKEGAGEITIIVHDFGRLVEATQDGNLIAQLYMETSGVGCPD